MIFLAIIYKRSVRMKILILSASTGGGHVRASRAIRDYIQQHYPESSVDIVDALKCINGFINHTICDGYRMLAIKVPKIFGQLYQATNKESPLYHIMNRFSNAFSHALLPTLNDIKPDAIISTHPFVTEMISHLKSIGETDAPLITLMTDYGLHRAWIADHVDAYVVASASMIPQMEFMGVDRSKVYPFGIPVENVFFTKADKPALLKKFGLDPSLPTVLIMAGSFGVTKILNIYRQLVHTDIVFQIVVITGKNEKLYAAFADEVEKSPKKTKLIYFTDEVENFMHASDLLVTKPGGLTVSEALACNIPLAVFDAIPGQEEDNADFLLSNNMAVKLEPGTDCGKTIRSLLEDNRRLEQMRSNCEEFDKSHAAENIVELTRKLGGQHAEKHKSDSVPCKETKSAKKPRHLPRK